MGLTATMATLFEVHTLKGGKWMVDSTYPDRDAAIDVAKSLHGEKRFEGVKVIKDTFDPKTNASREIVVYDTSKPVFAKGSAAPAKESKAPAKADKKAEVDFKGGPAHKAASQGSPLTKVVLLICVLLLLGAGLLFAAGHLVGFISKM
jgi:hypothetical protein